MKRPAPGASRRAVGTAPRQRERIPPVAYRVRRAVKVEGFAVREEEELGRERVDCPSGRKEVSRRSERALATGEKRSAHLGDGLEQSEGRQDKADGCSCRAPDEEVAYGRQFGLGPWRR